MEGNLSEEKHFDQLYSTAFYTVIENFSPKIDDIHEAIISIVESFKTFEYTKIDFYKKEFLCGYFYKYSTLNTAVARNRFLDAFDKCDTLKSTIKKSDLNVISLGGGSGTDMICFLSALQEKERKTSAKFNLTVVDLWRGWEDFYDIIMNFVQERNFGNVSKLFQSNDICTNFTPVDLKDILPPEEYVCDLSKSDIVLLVRVLDVYDECTRGTIILNIARRMKNEALLLLIDTINPPHLDSFGLSRLYSSDLEDFYLTVEQESMYDLPLPSKQSKAQITVYEKKKKKELLN